MLPAYPLRWYCARGSCYDDVFGTQVPAPARDQDSRQNHKRERRDPLLYPQSEQGRIFS